MPKRSFSGASRPKRAKLSAPAKRVLGKFVKSCMDKEAELKHSATTLAATATASAGSIAAANLLVLSSQGTGVGQRVGNQWQLKRLVIRGVLTLPAATVGDTVRILLVVDRAPNGAVAAVTDVLQSASYISDYNLDNVSHMGTSGRFSILSDRTVDLSPTGPIVATGTGVVLKHFTISKKMNMPVMYKGNAGTVADLMKNNLFVFAISKSGIATWEWIANACYVDL